MSSNIQFTSELSSAIPVGSAGGKARLFRDQADGLLKLKDHLGAITSVAGVRDFKEAVRVASTTALPAYTRIGNVITANALGALPAQDGVTLVANDAFIYAGGVGPTAPDNGVYTVTQAGSGGTPFILTRRGDFSDSSQVAPGMVIPTGPEGTDSNSKIYILATAAPIVLNTTGLDFEVIGAGAASESSYALTEITEAKTIPEDQSMVYMDDVVIGDSGDLILEGDVLTARTEDNFSVDLVPARSTRVVQATEIMLHTSSLQVDGDLVVDGDLFDVTPPPPLDGQGVLDLLTSIAPGTPAILGVSSPASFLGPSAARTVIDVYSKTETQAAIDLAIEDIPSGAGFDTFWNASSNSDGSFSGSDLTHAVSFTAAFSRVEKWDGSASGIVGTLPVCVEADHNKRIAFIEVAGSRANELTIAAAGSSVIRSIEDGSSNLTSYGVKGINRYVELQYDFSVDTWRVVKEFTGLKGFVNNLHRTTAVGLLALENIDFTGSPDNNTGVGYQALQALTLGTSNTAVGTQALQSMDTGAGNTAVGNGALALAVSINSNTAVGNSALAVLNSGGSNVAVGSNALDSLTSGSNNVGIGNNALQGQASASDNTAVGSGAMGGGTVSGTANVAVGRSALAANTTASNNVAVGANALLTVTTGTRNTAVGFDALRLAITGTSDNTAVGYQAARSMTSGQLNTAVGTSALFTQTTATTCTAIGFETLFTNNASSATAVGYQSMRANTSGTNNTALGYQSLDANTTGAGNTAVGNAAIGGAVAQANNTAVGASALGASGAGSNNTAIGAEALSIATGGNSTAVGYQALRASTAVGNTSVGYQSLDANTSGTNNTALGTSALGANTSPSGNTAIGFQVLLVSNGSGNNTGVGDSVLDALATGGNNTAVGQNAMGALNGSSDNVAVGQDAMAVATSSDNTTAIGKGAGSLLSTGDGNTFIGYRAGDTCTTGGSNIVIGADADVPTAGTSNYLNIGNTVIGDVSTGDAGVARFLLRSVTAGITASTTQTQGQGALTKDINQVSVVANTNDTVTLPSAAAGMEIIVINSGANTLQVFPASGDNLGAGVNTATIQLTGVTNRYVAYDATNWVKSL